MKKCPRCAEEVQDEAKVCRHCGYKFSAGARADDWFKNLGCLGFGAIFVVIALAVNECEGPTQPQPGVPTMAQAEEIASEEAIVKARLRDPDSAVFRHLGGGCGYVNSKNGFGGMAGNQQYIVGTAGHAVFREDGSHRTFDKFWKNCFRAAAH